MQTRHTLSSAIAPDCPFGGPATMSVRCGARIPILRTGARRFRRHASQFRYHFRRRVVLPVTCAPDGVESHGGCRNMPPSMSCAACTGNAVTNVSHIRIRQNRASVNWHFLRFFQQFPRAGPGSTDTNVLPGLVLSSATGLREWLWGPQMPFPAGRPSSQRATRLVGPDVRGAV